MGWGGVGCGAVPEARIVGDPPYQRWPGWVNQNDCENKETSTGEEAESVKKNLDSEERFNVNDPDLLNLSTSDGDEVLGVGNNSHDGCPKTAVKTIKTKKDSEVEEDAESNVKIQTPMPDFAPWS